MEAIALRVAARYAKRELNLAQHGLEGLVEGRTSKLYHGTTAMFRSFDMARSRGELVDSYYGKGIFLTPRKRVAEEYAEANRNMGFPDSILEDLSSKNKGAGALLKAMYDHGHEKGWDLWAQDSGIIQEDGSWDNDILEKVLQGIDGNDLTDIAEYVIGANFKPHDEGFVNIFSQRTGLPSHMYNSLDAVGLDSKVYRPKVYTVTVRVENVLVTPSKAKAKSARSKGYDCVIFHGSDLVMGEPEVAVFSSKNVRISKVEMV